MGGAVASIAPLIIALSIVGGSAFGAFLVHWVKAGGRNPAAEERERDEIARRAARKAVTEALTRLR